MTRKRKEFPILENITITDVAAEGKALPGWTTWWFSFPLSFPEMWST